MNRIEQNVLVITARQYQVINRETGVVENEGCSVKYLASENLVASEDHEKKLKGYLPIKAVQPFSDYDKFTTVPGIYKATLVVNVTSDGKADLKATGFEFLRNLDDFGVDSFATKGTKNT